MFISNMWYVPPEYKGTVGDTGIAAENLKALIVLDKKDEYFLLTTNIDDNSFKK